MVGSEGLMTFLREGKMIRPNFFIIGAPKCGTTALSQYLSEHPRVFISSSKEPQYFDFDLTKHHQPSLEEYLGYYRGADPAIHLAVGESSTSHLFSKRAVPEILKFNPGARFIVMLRNPVDLVYSFHSEMFFCGIESVEDFEKAWRLEKERDEGRGLPPLCVEKDRLRYSQWGKLGDQMERLFSLVPREKVLVIIYDDFMTNTAETYRSVLEFLGVRPDHRKNFPRINENKILRWPRVQKYLAFMATQVWKIKNRLNVGKSLGVLTGLIHLNRKFYKRPPLREGLREELADFYQSDVEKLGRLLGRDLSHWVRRENSSRS